MEFPEQLIATERRALDRWGSGDPHGYLEIEAEEITYFDPLQEARVDGLAEMTKLMAPLAGKIHIDRYDMIRPCVQRHGDVAVLSYNLVDYGSFDGGPTMMLRWNCTEVYAQIDGAWKIIHNHWSYIKPELKQSSDR